LGFGDAISATHDNLLSTEPRPLAVKAVTAFTENDVDVKDEQ
jgi:hypothetical protein